ncbi:MAG: serine hydrolase, partial [Elusimicrobiota bacterium]|nr:serine hydrolase [Elusimicrobiota bacterium]
MKKVKVVFVLIVIFCIRIAAAQVYAQSISSRDISTLGKILNQPQTDRFFPLNPKDKNYIRSILPSSFVQFIGYEKQGYIIVVPKDVEKFDIFINDSKIDSSLLQKNKINKINISKFTKNGTNIIQVSNIIGNGYVRVQIPYPEIIEALDEYKDNNTFKLIDAIISAEVRNGFPAAQLVIIKDGKMIKRTSYGYINNYMPNGKPMPEEQKIKVDNNTMFDLASNTKMFATNFAAQKLVSDGKISVEDLISKYIP